MSDRLAWLGDDAADVVAGIQSNTPSYSEGRDRLYAVIAEISSGLSATRSYSPAESMNPRIL